MNKTTAQFLMFGVTALLVLYAYFYARPLLETALPSTFKLTLGAHIGIAIDWLIRKVLAVPDDHPSAYRCMATLAGAGMVAMAWGS